MYVPIRRNSQNKSTHATITAMNMRTKMAQIRSESVGSRLRFSAARLDEMNLSPKISGRS